jgi:hypothetical protein
MGIEHMFALVPDAGKRVDVPRSGTNDHARKTPAKRRHDHS